MPFGLLNAAQTFQWFIDHVLHSLDFTYEKTVLIYVSDAFLSSTVRQTYRVAGDVVQMFLLRCVGHTRVTF